MLLKKSRLMQKTATQVDTPRFVLNVTKRFIDGGQNGVEITADMETRCVVNKKDL